MKKIYFLVLFWPVVLQAVQNVSLSFGTSYSWINWNFNGQDGKFISEIDKQYIGDNHTYDTLSFRKLSGYGFGLKLSVAFNKRVSMYSSFITFFKHWDFEYKPDPSYHNLNISLTSFEMPTGLLFLFPVGNFFQAGPDIGLSLLLNINISGDGHLMYYTKSYTLNLSDKLRIIDLGGYAGFVIKHQFQNNFFIHLSCKVLCPLLNHFSVEQYFNRIVSLSGEIWIGYNLKK